MYTCAIFDLDGTILDTLTDLKHSVNRVLTGHGYPALTDEETRQRVGNGMKMLLRRSVSEDTTEEALEALFQEFKADYRENCDIFTGPYEGVSELLCRLREKGIKLAVVSNKMDVATKKLIRHHFPGLFSYVLGETAGIRKKPVPDMVLKAMKELDAEPEKTLYFGDGETDIEAAKAAGLTCVCVTWGFRDRAQLAAAGGEHFIDRVCEIESCLEQS